ncbi:MAG TPA: DUF5808 domain-containing protein [Ktedonobacteraceae bacterium]|nr:DUF5808 domain-containing protein [Ktedonobacteraceae bacterium]
MDNMPPEYQTNPYQTRVDEARLRESQFSPNPNNPPLFVPKRFGFGWSPNFANPAMAWGCLIGVGALLAVAILIPLVALLLAAHH